MHGPSLAITLVLILLGVAGPSSAGTPEALAEARRKLAREDGIAAVTILETALPEAGASKDAVLELLQQAYDVAARQAQQAGRPREAETYRENRQILARRSRAPKGIAGTPARPASDSPGIPARPTHAGTPPIDPPPVAPNLLPDGPTPPPEVAPAGPPEDGGLPETVPPPGPDPLGGGSEPGSPAAPPAPAAGPVSDLAAADAAFVAREYREAGRIYGSLAKHDRLPAERRDQWLYCRASEVVARINARPGTEADWTAIRSEIDQIRALNPKNYLGEYLRDLAAEKQGAARKARPPRALVVRGSAPEEPPAVDRSARAAAANGPVPTANPAAVSPSAARIGTNVGRWQVLDSANFRVYHADPALAAKVARAAEAARSDQMKRWAGSAASKAGWQPQCEIYLYPTARQYAQMTGQPEDSPGFSTMGMNAGRITSRRINLRADHPTLVAAVLPHEITHAILADHFTEQQIPRWADEGLAVLSEPVDEQQRRAVDLVTPLAENRLFAVDALMGMDYPDTRYWNLYYAQSVSLARFLVEQGTPAQMIQFLQGSQRDGYEATLRRVYKIDGFPDLQRRWLAYARSKVAGRAPTATATAPQPDLKVR